MLDPILRFPVHCGVVSPHSAVLLLIRVKTTQRKIGAYVRVQTSPLTMPAAQGLSASAFGGPLLQREEYVTKRQRAVQNCSPIRKKNYRSISGRCIQSCMKARKNAVLLPSRKRSGVSPRPKHRHDWYKSLAGGFRCVCEMWRCESTEGRKQCDSAAEQARKYCLAHSAPTQ
jgi:hypothetical protein